MVSSVIHFEDPLHAVNLTAKELQGSASQFAGDLEGVDDLWVHSFERDCSLLSPPELQPFCRYEAKKGREREPARWDDMKWWD